MEEHSTTFKHSHAVPLGKWTDTLENACMLDEEDPLYSTSDPEIEQTNVIKFELIPGVAIFHKRIDVAARMAVLLEWGEARSNARLSEWKKITKATKADLARGRQRGSGILILGWTSPI